MGRNAVLLTVLFAFLVTLFSVSYIFIEFYKLNREQYINNTFLKYSVITRIYQEHMQTHTSATMLEANLALYNLYSIEDGAAAEKIVDSAKILKSESFQAQNDQAYLQIRPRFDPKSIIEVRISMLEHEGFIYFFLQGPNSGVLLLDEKIRPYRAWNLLYAYLVILSSITISYILIFMRLRPLRQLRKKIRDFGAGKMQSSFKMRGEDEIAVISNELENTRQKIRNLIESRTLFMRNIMHELKTPIAKGRISAEMLESGKQKERFNRIFLRMESLINEFALVEEVSTGFFSHASCEEYRLIDLIDGAIDLAMVEETKVSQDVDAKLKVTADFNLFATAIKNMIDNAMKYSPDKQIKISTHEGEIWFESRGERLKQPL
ncbi:MAG: ArsS family sensor histidine kinase, partial [Thiovulaceae bacterium]|nr:ArsS family sensor histidine kinase [Sulfurimonadaceae bacterium]